MTEAAAALLRPRFQLQRIGQCSISVRWTCSGWARAAVRTRFQAWKSRQTTVGLAYLEIGQTVPGIQGGFNFLNTEATLFFTTDSVSAHTKKYILYKSHVRVTPGRVQAGSSTFATPLL